VKEQDEGLSEEELIGMIYLLAFAGHQTTIQLIGNGMYTLMQHPEQLVKLIANPALIAPAIEELLRFNGPVLATTVRFAREDVPIGGQVIPKGEKVMVLLGAANHEPGVFENPDNFDITRENNPHLTFSYGIHYCLGAPLARLEGEIAISTLLRRLPNIRPAVPMETLPWIPSLILHGLYRLPIVFGT
jgi:cytochrome P450 PksS